MGLKLISFFLSLVALYLAYAIFDITIDFDSVIWVLILGFIILVFSLARVFLIASVSDFDGFFLLASDILFISLLVMFTGGTSNPFSSSILVTLAVAIAVLPKHQSLILVVASVIAYAFWTFNGNDHAHHDVSFELHLYGMWINFLVSAVLLFVFISYATRLLRENEKQLRIAREKILRDEQLVGIATLTASTAHSLATPLSTMSILLEDVEEGDKLESSCLKMLKEQIAVCRSYLSGVVQAAKQSNIVDYRKITVEELITQLKQHINLLFPQANVEFKIASSELSAAVKYSQTLFFAVANIIDNAIQSCESKVSIEVVKSEQFCIKISDDGPGIDKTTVENLSRPFISSQSSGMGVGIFLTNSTIEQAGGSLKMTTNSHGGSCVELNIPYFS